VNDLDGLETYVKTRTDREQAVRSLTKGLERESISAASVIARRSYEMVKALVFEEDEHAEFVEPWGKGLKRSIRRYDTGYRYLWIKRLPGGLNTHSKEELTALIAARWTAYVMGVHTERLLGAQI